MSGCTLPLAQKSSEVRATIWRRRSQLSHQIILNESAPLGYRDAKRRSRAAGRLTRVSKTHVRVGTFEFFANRDDVDGVRVLADYVIARLYPEAQSAAQPYLELLKAVIARTAKLIASWQLVGFIHGVMNTDNTSIAGETIDYGPCAFMDAYHAGQVFSSIDHQGRYAYANQPRIAHWNLMRFAESLLPLLDADGSIAVDAAKAALESYPAQFESALAEGFRAKVGFARHREGDLAFIAELLERMAEGLADCTLTFPAAVP